MDEHTLGRMLGAAMIPVFWLLVLTLCKWAVRRWKPEWERILWMPLSSLIIQLQRRFRANRRSS